jgi:uncharacterized protein YggU (UPF0235/DUF167 family)
LSGDDAPASEGTALRVFLDGENACVGVRVSPSAPRIELRGVYGDRLKLAVSAPPEDNRANRQVEGALAGWLGLPANEVRVLSGHASRDKVIAFTGLGRAELTAGLDAVVQRCRKTGEGGLVGS